MNDKKVYAWKFNLQEKSGYYDEIICPEFVNEDNWEAWRRYLRRLIERQLCEETMQTAEFQKELKAVRQAEAERLERDIRWEENREAAKRRRCMERPRRDYIPKGLTVDLEAAYAEYFRQEVTFVPQDKEDFLYMLRLIERWEKKSVPMVLATERPDAAYAIAKGLCEHLPLLLEREDLVAYLREYRLRIGKLIVASFAALVESVTAWNHEEKRKEVADYITDSLSQFDDYKYVQKKLLALVPKEKFVGEPVKIVREMNDEEERAVWEAGHKKREIERLRRESEAEPKSLIPLNKEYEEFIFDERSVGWDCDTIWYLMLNENKNIEILIELGEYQQAAQKFLQLTKSMCRHFVMDRHWEYFDDMYSPEYAINNLMRKFEELAKKGTLPEAVNDYLHEGWKEIAAMESCTNYGIPCNKLPF